jgi:hypothetical protein
MRDLLRLTRKDFLLAISVLVCGLGVTPLAASGQTVTYTLSINDNGTSTYTPGDFAVYASDSTADGNFGISAFIAELSGYDSIENATPFLTWLEYEVDINPQPPPVLVHCHAMVLG